MSWGGTVHMRSRLQTILDALNGSSLLSTGMFSQLDCDAILDARDGDRQFEERWAGLVAEVNLRWDAARPGDEIGQLAEAIRERAFIAASEATGRHEVASYVSDDFDLIARGLATGVTNPFLDEMWAAYQQGRIPCPLTVRS